jgi:protein-S-isoprenylcysteine O-methyltransferase Ste14
MVFLNLVSKILLILVYLLSVNPSINELSNTGEKREEKKKQKLILLHFDILLFFFFFVFLKFVCPIMQVFILFSVVVSLLFEFLALALLKGMHCSKLCFSNLSVS